MGFDPRQWPSGEHQPRRVTTNIDALLAENEALRREVQQLRRRLELLERPPRAARGPRWEQGSEAPPPPQPRVTAEQVRRWGDALAAQSGWRELRLGSEDSGLQGVIQDLNQRSFHPGLSLEQRLDRLAPGLGRDLHQALGAGAPSRKRLAILAAFALYGPSAIEWLDDDPRRVVAELRQRQQQLERSGSERRQGRRTSSDQRRTDRRDSDRRRTHQHDPDQHDSDRHSSDQRGSDQRASDQGSQGQRSQGQRSGSGQRTSASAGADVDPRRLAALRVLGLEWGASRQAIKTAHRRLVKQHHPDMGGRAEDFHRVNDAYQLLVA